MSIYNKVPDHPTAAPAERVRLDERFVSLLVTEDAQDRLEAQELRQLIYRALQALSDDELRVIQLRYQYKKSPGQVAAQLGIARTAMAALEQSGLAKLRRGLEAWHQGV